jgi:hypothetical protein
MSCVSIKLVQTLLAISIIHLRMEVLQLKKKKEGTTCYSTSKHKVPSVIKGKTIYLATPQTQIIPKPNVDLRNVSLQCNLAKPSVRNLV